MDSAPDTLTARVAAFAVDSKSDALADAALASGKRVILDTLGCMLAAAKRPIGQTIAGFAVDSSSAKATGTIVGTGLKASAPEAALANGTLANAMDLDAGWHQPTYLLAAALAVAERDGLSGRDLLAAYIIGDDIALKLTQAIDGLRRLGQGPTQRGLWHVGHVGPLACAAVAARLCGLDAEQTAVAIGIATTASAGFRRNMGTMSKALHSGNAAKAGINAVDLAARGFTADPDMIGAPMGFISSISLPPERDPTAITERLGTPFALETAPGFKVYPACTPAHGLIDATFAARRQPGFTLDGIESIEADLHTFSLLRSDPQDEDAAGFSAAFLVATALIHGEFGLEQVSEEAVHDPDIRALMARVVPAKSVKEGIDTVTIRYKGGKYVTGENTARPTYIYSDAETAAKFRLSAKGVIPASDVEALIEVIGTLETQPNLRRLMSLAAGQT